MIQARGDKRLPSEPFDLPIVGGRDSEKSFPSQFVMSGAEAWPFSYCSYPIGGLSLEKIRQRSGHHHNRDVVYHLPDVLPIQLPSFDEETLSIVPDTSDRCPVPLEPQTHSLHHHNSEKVLRETPSDVAEERLPHSASTDW